MIEHGATLRVFVLAGISCVLGVSQSTAQDVARHGAPSPREIRLLQDADAPTIRLLDTGRALERPKHWVRMELQAARAQAEDWLKDAGLSLLEERDPEGRRRYQLTSDVLSDNWPLLRLRARLGRPELSAGLRVRRDVPAVGITVPWQRYAFELEGLADHDLGYAFTGSMRWSDPQGSVQYGLAFPLAFRGGASIGVLLQFGVRLGR